MSILDYYNFTHPLDKKALAALRAVPLFTQFLKAYMKFYSDRANHMENMSSKVLLGPNQLPRIYEMLPPVCARLGIDVPPLYLELDNDVNAYTRGDNIPDITITTGLLDHMSDEEVQVVIAHECGHIACHHVLFQTVGSMVMSGAAAVANLPGVGDALQMAFAYWIRCSELSADRAAAVFCGDAQKVAKVMFRLAGCPKGLEDETSLEAFMGQASAYEEFMADSSWNRLISLDMTAYNSHPLTAVRASEISKWGATEEFATLMKCIDEGSLQKLLPASWACPSCQMPLSPESSFCPGCGRPVNAAAPRCQQCQAPIQPGMRFCSACGAPVSSVPAPSPAMPSMAPEPKMTGTDKIRSSLHDAWSNAMG